MSKLKITQKQYDAIILHEQNSRKELLSENIKDLTLTIALLTGIKLTGQNEHTVNNLIKDKKNMQEMKSTLEDENKMQDLVDALTEKGMKDPEGRLSRNADKIVAKFNEIAEKEKLNLKLDFLTSNNLKNLTDK